ncbi:hypothetical protein ACIBL8_48225 [Streptomyces sp. NPDC050523]
MLFLLDTALSIRGRIARPCRRDGVFADRGDDHDIGRGQGQAGRRG